MAFKGLQKAISGESVLSQGADQSKTGSLIGQMCDSGCVNETEDRVWKCAWNGSIEHCDKRTLEHALGKQFGELLGSNPGAYEVERSHESDDDPSSNFERSWDTTSPTDWVTRKYCETCNSGWMADIDNAAKPVVKRLLEATNVVQLSVGEVEVLRIWAYKLALVFEHVCGHPVHGDSACGEFADTKTVPSNVAVALGAAIGSIGPSVFSVQRSSQHDSLRTR